MKKVFSKAGTILEQYGEYKPYQYQSDWRIMDALDREGYEVYDNGLIAKEGEEPHPLYWFGEIPKPEAYILAKSALCVAYLYSEPERAICKYLPTYEGMKIQ